MKFLFAPTSQSASNLSLSLLINNAPSTGDNKTQYGKSKSELKHLAIDRYKMVTEVLHLDLF